MKLQISRRQFLKISGALGGLSILTPVWDVVSNLAAEEPLAVKNSTTQVPSICNFCSSFCDIQVDVKKVNGVKRVVKINGNPHSPLNRGKICARGQSGWLQTYDPDRLKVPLIRVEGSKRGQWEFRKATWEEAYDYIASKLKKVNPWEISMVGGWTACVSYMHFSLPFIGAYQIPNIIASPLQHCVTAGHFGTDLVTGNFNVHDEILADFENARYILFSLNNASVAAISVARAVRFGQAKKKGARVVCLDPRMSELASKADEWLPIKPGSDMAFFLAMLHTILRKELYDENFVALHTNAPFLAYKDKAGRVKLLTKKDRKGKVLAYYVYDQISEKIRAVPGFVNTNDRTVDGKKVVPALRSPKKMKWPFNGEAKGLKVQTVFDYFFDSTKEYTPAWASKITSIDAETIERIATEFGQSRPALVDPGWMGARYPNLIPLRRVQAMIQTLVGGIDKPGGWLMGGEYKHKAQNYWERERKNKPQPKNVAELPGMKFAEALVGLMANPKAWKHGRPAFSFAWAQQQQKEGKAGALLPALADSGLLDAVEGKLKYNGQPYKIKAFILNAANPVRHYFPGDRWEKILSHENVELVVAIDVLPSDSLPYADVILPNHTYLERNEPLLYPLGPAPYLAFATRFRTVDPLYDTRDAVDILFEIADRLGFYDEYLAGVAEYAGLDLKRLRKEVYAAKKAGQPINEAFLKTAIESMAHFAEHVTHKHTRAEDIEKELKEKGVLVLKSQHEMLTEAAIPEKIPAPTASGRLELYSSFLAQFAESFPYQPMFDPVVAYVNPEIKDPGNLAEDEFLFTYGKTPVVSHASTNSNNKLLAAVTRQKEDRFMGLWMNATKAERLGLSDGDRITIENTKDGRKVAGKLFVTEMIRPDTVFLPSSFGSKNPALSVASGKGTPLSDLIPYQIEPMTASFMSQKFTVRIKKA